MSDIRDRIGRIGPGDDYRLDPPNLGDSWGVPEYNARPTTRPETTTTDDSGGVSAVVLVVAALVIGVLAVGN